MDDQGVLLRRRVIPSENSCLFNAVGEIPGICLRGYSGVSPRRAEYSRPLTGALELRRRGEGSMDDDGILLRRVIPSDNSCLFNAVSYVMEHNRDKSRELREVIAATVLSDPNTYNDAFLGKTNNDYCQWILNPDKWGGAIELAILSDYYKREIAAYDIQTTRCDLYGQGKGYQERVMLLYDGLHYDALALSPVPSASEDMDQSIFNVDESGDIGPVSRLAMKFVQEEHRKRKFTDTANFTLRCGVCQQGVIGQKEAVEHAKMTGHTNFQEYMSP